jgi:hypothetical protein
MPGLDAEERQGQAQVVVEISLGFEDREPGREEVSRKFLGG